MPVLTGVLVWLALRKAGSACALLNHKGLMVCVCVCAEAWDYAISSAPGVMAACQVSFVEIIISLWRARQTEWLEHP